MSGLSPVSDAKFTAVTNAESATVLLLSDLHLPPEPSPYRDAFIAFLAGPARAARAVYILGDLFDAWMGDDIGLEDFAPECTALRTLTGTGVRVAFMHGNRDFLVGKRFAKATGIELLTDPCCVELPDGPALLSHGDLLCSDDVAYQRYRRIVHNPIVQWLFLRLPNSLRRAITRRLRAGSHARKLREGEASISDVNIAAVHALLTASDQTRLIHGHTHRPADHRLQLAQKPASRIVLADWRVHKMGYLVSTPRGCRRVLLPSSP